MMLDVDFAELSEGFLQYMPIGATVGLILLLELLLVFGASQTLIDAPAVPRATPDGMTNAEALGRVLYTDYIYFFQAAGAILLVAMIGAIVLTLVVSNNPKKQDIAKQVARRRDEAVDYVDVKPGDGI
jgi:NADH-quinone oxidoreductase subunit J